MNPVTVYIDQNKLLDLKLKDLLEQENYLDQGKNTIVSQVVNLDQIRERARNSTHLNSKFLIMANGKSDHIGALRGLFKGVTEEAQHLSTMAFIKALRNTYKDGIDIDSILKEHLGLDNDMQLEKYKKPLSVRVIKKIDIEITKAEQKLRGDGVNESMQKTTSSQKINEFTKLKDCGGPIEQLKQIARMVYGNGVNEGSKGGYGLVGMINGCVAKYETKYFASDISHIGFLWKKGEYNPMDESIGADGLNTSDKLVQYMKENTTFTPEEIEDRMNALNYSNLSHFPTVLWRAMVNTDVGRDFRISSSSSMLDVDMSKMYAASNELRNVLAKIVTDIFGGKENMTQRAKQLIAPILRYDFDNECECNPIMMTRRDVAKIIELLPVACKLHNEDVYVCSHMPSKYRGNFLHPEKEGGLVDGKVYDPRFPVSDVEPLKVYDPTIRLSNEELLKGHNDNVAKLRNEFRLYADSKKTKGEFIKEKTKSDDIDEETLSVEYDLMRGNSDNRMYKASSNKYLSPDNQHFHSYIPIIDIWKDFDKNSAYKSESLMAFDIVNAHYGDAKIIANNGKINQLEDTDDNYVLNQLDEAENDVIEEISKKLAEKVLDFKTGFLSEQDKHNIKEYISLELKDKLKSQIEKNGFFDAPALNIKALFVDEENYLGSIDSVKENLLSSFDEKLREINDKNVKNVEDDMIGFVRSFIDEQYD